MSASTRKYLDRIILGATGNAVISELQDATPEAKINLLVGETSGYYEPVFMGIESIKPDVVFTSPQLNTILTALNAGAAPFLLDCSAGNTDLFYRDAPNKGVRTALATTSHERFRMAAAVLYWTQISARQEERATIDCRLKPIYDGTNNPVVAAGTVAITGTDITDEWYTLGPVNLNSAAIDGVQEIRLESGIVLDEIGTDGELFDGFCGLEKTVPVLSITGPTIEWWNTYGFGTALTGLDVFLRRKNGTGNYPDTDTPSRHIKISGSAGLIFPDRTNGRKSSTTLKVALAAPAIGTASLTVSVAADIS